MADAEAEERERRARELEDFAQQCRRRLEEVASSLGWSMEVLERAASEESPVVCPINSGHRMPAASLERHVETCRLSAQGYSKDDQEKMIDTTFFYEKANVPSIKIDKEQQAQIIREARVKSSQGMGLFAPGEYSVAPGAVPLTYDRAACELTRADRVAIYDFMVAEAARMGAAASQPITDELYIDWAAKLKKAQAKQSGPKSHLEVLAEMRDYKRRRQSYRAKNVHITRRSHTEILREVITVHTGELARQWREDAAEGGEVEGSGGEAAAAPPSNEDAPDNRTADRRSRSRSRETRRLDDRETRTRSQNRGWGRDHNPNRSREQSRERSRNTSRHQSPERSRHGSRDRSRDLGRRNRSPERSKNWRQDRSRIQIPVASHSRNHSRDRSPERQSRKRDRSRDRDESAERSRNRSRHQSPNQSPKRSGSRNRSPERQSRKRDRSRDRDESAERNSNLSRHRSPNQSPKRSRSRNRSRNRNPDPNSDRSSSGSGSENSHGIAEKKLRKKKKKKRKRKRERSHRKSQECGGGGGGDEEESGEAT
ncbi:U11/U12 small nuclear ribonucleoprotein 48 kDa protein [Lampetra fluviatilis]